METKVCKDCRFEKLKVEFAVNKDRKDGYNTACKQCDLLYNKSRRLAMGMKPRFKRPEKEILAELYKIKTVNQIAEHLGCSNSSVSRWLKIYEIQPVIKKYNFNKLDENILIDLYFNQKKSMDYIAEVFDCSAYKVKTALDRLNLKTRNLIESHTLTNPDWLGYEEIAGRYWTRIKNGAESRGIAFDVTIEEIWTLFLNQGRRCILSGEELVMQTAFNKHTASLDRIDSSKGYTIDNLQWVHKHLNIMKRDHEQSYFISLCKKVADYRA